MGQARRLLRSIDQASVQIALRNAAKRWRKYLHRAARERLARQERAMVDLQEPNRACSAQRAATREN
jgi:DNA topoisomerase VI subunit B